MGSEYDGIDWDTRRSMAIDGYRNARKLRRKFRESIADAEERNGGPLRSPWAYRAFAKYAKVLERLIEWDGVTLAAIATRNDSMYRRLVPQSFPAYVWAFIRVILGR